MPSISSRPPRQESKHMKRPVADRHPRKLAQLQEDETQAAATEGYPDTLHELLTEAALAAARRQRPDGSLQPGHNGPWRHEDTPTRVTAHWGILFAHAHRWTGDSYLEEAAYRTLEYLIASERRPAGLAFQCRLSGGKDGANNLIGQAWILEALLDLSDHFDSQAALEIAYDLALLHKFDPRANLWRRIDVNKPDAGLNFTLNQQVMFSGISLRIANLTGDEKLATMSRRVLLQAPKQALWSEHGLPHHHVLPLYAYPVSRQLTRGLNSRLGRKLFAARWTRQTIGYLSFVLYGLALARLWNPEDTIWNDGRLTDWTSSLLRYAADRRPFGKDESVESFRWSYNPTGFEVAFAMEQFAGDSCADDAHWWVRAQLDSHYDTQRKSLSRNTLDPFTLSARIYQATRLRDFILDPEESASIA